MQTRYSSADDCLALSALDGDVVCACSLDDPLGKQLALKSEFWNQGTVTSHRFIRPRTTLVLSILAILFLSILSFAFVSRVAASPSVVATVPVGYSPEGVAYDSGKNEIFVANSYSGYGSIVSVISDTTPNLVASINVGPLGRGPYGVAYDSGKAEVFVANPQSNNVSVISDATNGVVATIKVGNTPYGVAYDGGKGEVFVANYYSHDVSVISDATNTVVATVDVVTSPVRVAYDSGAGTIYVVNTSNIVTVISDATNAVVATVNVGTNPIGVAYDSSKGEVFVANYGSNTVTVISDSTYSVLATIPVGIHPWGVEYDSGTGQVFVTNDGSNTVSVISDATNSVVATVNVGSHPHGPAYDSRKGWIFVANSGGGTVTVISDGTLTPDFTISGNPSSQNTPPSVAVSSTITVTAVNSFTGTVTVSQNGGTSCSLSAPSITLTSTTQSNSVTLTCAYSTVGSHSVTLTGTSGSLTHTSTVTFEVGDFTIAANPTSVGSLNINEAGSSTITVAAVNGLGGTVQLTTSIAPSTGLTCTLTPSSVALGASSTSMLSCYGSTGTYAVTVTGARSSLSHSTTVTYNVGGMQDFTLSASPTIVTAMAGSSGSSIVTVAAVNGFTGTVALAQNGGSTCSLSGTSIILSSTSASDHVTLSCTYSNAGINALTVTGTSGSLSHPATVTFKAQSSTPIGCGTGCTASITSDATISNVVSTSTTIRFTASGQSGTTAFANVTISKSSVPSLNALQVSLDGSPTTPSITSSSTDYFVYFTFPATSSPAPIEIRFAATPTPENAAPLIFGLPTSLLTAIVAAIAAIGSALIGLLYRASKGKAKAEAE